MKKILILGAGRSSASLISYLLQHKEWHITVGDFSEESAKERVKGYDNARAIAFNINNEALKQEEITKADLVISMLPPLYHLTVAETCVELGKHLLTASYMSPEIAALDEKAKQKDVIILMECGLDPGIDHMSALKEINKLKEGGGKITSFNSYTGGLVAPESDNNPWHYKVSWNPRNVVLAGQGTVKYLQDGQYSYIPYHKLFSRTEKIVVTGHGEFEGYANRDSLKYLSVYGLDNISTFIRGTLRKPGYCEAWNVFVQLGITDDSYVLENSTTLTYKDFISSYLPVSDKSVKDCLREYLQLEEEVLFKLEWMGLFNDEKIGMEHFTPAQVLQQLIERRWKLEKVDKDMIVMQHKFGYQLHNKKKELTSSLVVIGDDSIYTAMAKTVGLPLAIAAKLILQDKIKLTGVHIPVVQELYEPILTELEEYGIIFKSEEKDI